MSAGDAREFVDELIDSQLLVATAGISVTGTEPLEAFEQQLRQYPSAAETTALLESIRVQLTTIDRRGKPGLTLARYRGLGRQLEQLPAPVTLKRLVQVDMMKPTPTATLGEAVLRELSRGVEVLQRLAPEPRASELIHFREAFAARYERRAVPLVEALDEEVGIGLTLGGSIAGAAAPRIAGLPFVGRYADHQPWGKREQLLLGLLCAALEQQQHEVVIGRAELDALEGGDTAPLPGAFAVMARVLASSQSAVDRGDFRLVLTGTDGPSGARMLGRFCHVDPTLHRMVEEHLRAEEALEPDAVFAEIVHLPHGGIGNLVFRPVLREYEISYLGQSGAPPERQLPVTDLLVSVEGEQILLHSKRLGRRVIPRLTGAHAFRIASLTIYRFLCLLQNDRNSPGLWFDWGALAGAPFLPRVTTGRLVLRLRDGVSTGTSFGA